MFHEPLLSQQKQLSADQLYYINHQPKILLEIISARTTFLILLLTYCSFIVCFTVDIVNTSAAFTNSNTLFHPAPYPENNHHKYIQLSKTSTYYHRHHQISYTSKNSSILVINSTKEFKSNPVNDTRDVYSWNATVYQQRNVISTQLTISQTNFSKITNWTTISNMAGPPVPDAPPDTHCPMFANLNYDVTLWACYQSNGCSDFSQSSTNNHKHTWHESLRLTQQKLSIDLCPLVIEKSITISLFPNTLQNQEAIPTNGVVKSYFVQISIYDNDYQLFIPFNPEIAESISYNVHIVSRHGIAIRAATIILSICIFIVMGSLITFIKIMYSHQPNPRKWLPEQLWIILYLLSLIFYLNPIYCVVFWYKESTPSAILAYITYILDAIGQSSVFLIWLFLADPLNYRFRHWMEFYLPKIFLIFWIFLSYIIIITYQFPSIANHIVPQSRSPVQAVCNWPVSTQKAFVGFSIVYLLLQGIWFILWFGFLFQTSYKLRKLSYMSTRYIQLSFRFFTLQASLVTLYYIFQYITVIYYLVRSSHTHSPTITQLADDVNTLFKEQTQTAGKLIFLTIYALILAFLFLPCSESNNMINHDNDNHIRDVSRRSSNTNNVNTRNISNSNSHSIAAKLAVTYVLTEKQLKSTIIHRKSIISQLNSMQQSLLNNITTYQPYVFCVERAVLLCQASYEVYYEYSSSSSSSSSSNSNGSGSNSSGNNNDNDNGINNSIRGGGSSNNNNSTSSKSNNNNTNNNLSSGDKSHRMKSIDASTTLMANNNTFINEELSQNVHKDQINVDNDDDDDDDDDDVNIIPSHQKITTTTTTTTNSNSTSFSTSFSSPLASDTTAPITHDTIKESHSTNTTTNDDVNNNAVLRYMKLDGIGYEYIASRNDEAHDTFCCIARHPFTRSLLIVFRGTSSKKHWNSNLQFRQRPVDILRDKPTGDMLPSIDSIFTTPSSPSSLNQDEIMKNMAGCVIDKGSAERVITKRRLRKKGRRRKERRWKEGSAAIVVRTIIPFTSSSALDLKGDDSREPIEGNVNSFHEHNDDDDEEEEVEEEEDEYSDDDDDDDDVDDFTPLNINPLERNKVDQVQCNNNNNDNNSSSNSSSSGSSNNNKSNNRNNNRSSSSGSSGSSCDSNDHSPARQPLLQQQQHDDDDDDDDDADNLEGQYKPQSSSSSSSSSSFSPIYKSPKKNKNQHSTNKGMTKRFFNAGTKVVKGSVRAVANTALGATATAAGVATAVGAGAGDIMIAAVEQMPVLKTMLVPNIHAGFWEAYSVVREFIHTTVRQELHHEFNTYHHHHHHHQNGQDESAIPLKNMIDSILITGHSLGGALATLCALDLTLHTIMDVNIQLGKLRKQQQQQQQQQEAVQLLHHHHLKAYRYPSAVHVCMYNFGAPRVGNRAFAQLYDKIVPDSFRVTVDGDLIPSLPPSFRFKHIGTEVLIDGMGSSGSIIIDPSFVEKRLITATKASVTAHSLDVHRKGLLSIIESMNYLSSQLLD